jgi:Protein of unknown function (DUF664)
MPSETEQFGNVFDRLGHEVLVQLEGLPQSALHWPLPLPQGDSLFTRALRLVEESAFWVLEVVGGQYMLHDQLPEARSEGTFADLALRYERWFTALHRIVDMLSDAALGLFVDVPPSYQDLFGGGTTTIRACLLHAVEQSALHVGHIQLICQLFADGERVLHEVVEYHEIST